MTASRTLRAGALGVLVLAVVWVFWPLSLGGSTTYLATHGSSMEPAFHADDLAILRSADHYAVGDVVAYWSDSLNTVVMHRIVSGDANGFVTQGDNNDWLDADRPPQDEILGRLFLRIPQGGKVIDAMGAPGFLVPVAGALLTALGSTRAPSGPRRHRARRHRAPAFSASTRARAQQVAVASAGVVLLGAAACCAFLVVPPTETETRTVQVTHQGQFSYTGTASRGTTYPTGTIETGDTVWTRLTRDLTVSFTGTITGPQPADVTGDLRLQVSVAAADGWSAVLDTGPVVPFVNGTATTSVAIDPAAAAALVDRHHEEVGSPGSPATLTVTPVGTPTGSIDGRLVEASTPEGLVFTVDEMSLRPAGELATALAPSALTSVPIDELVPRTFDLLALTVPFDVARRVAGGLLLTGLAALGVGAWIGRSGRGGVADRFVVRHADRILPVAAFDPGPAVVDVSDAESLHRVAERFDTVVLHHTGPDGDVFAVRDAETTYRFVFPETAVTRTPPPPPPPSVRVAPAPPTIPLPRVA